MMIIGFKEDAMELTGGGRAYIRLQRRGHGQTSCEAKSCSTHQLCVRLEHCATSILVRKVQVALGVVGSL